MGNSNGACCRQRAKECDQNTYFRADEVEPAVWNWIKKMIADSDMLAAGLHEQKEHLKKINKPLRDRLSVVETAVAEASQQMDRLLDLYF